MLQNLYFWIKKNEANNKHYHDGRYWTYNSTKAFSELFPYWSEKQISRILTNLENNGAIITGNYNKIAYDRTKWYALTDLALSIIQDEDIHFTKQGNGNDYTVKPIPDINTDSKPDNKPDIYYKITIYNSIYHSNIRVNKKKRVHHQLRQCTLCIQIIVGYNL